MAEQIELNDVLYDYLKSVSLREPEVLARLRAETAKLRYNFFQISAVEGQFLALLVKLTRTKRILEVGVFTGYSSTAMALAMPEDGRHHRPRHRRGVDGDRAALLEGGRRRRQDRAAPGARHRVRWTR